MTRLTLRRCVLCLVCIPVSSRLMCWRHWMLSL